MRRALCALLALFAIAQDIAAAELRPFERGTMAQLLAARKGRPFILSLWSIDCPHCKGTLRQLAAVAELQRRLDLVVVSTDQVSERDAIAAALAAAGLGRRDTWVFADEAPERLRYEIDRRWGGEMPRTYLFDGDQKFTAYSGPVGEADLRQWLARNGFAQSAP